MDKWIHNVVAENIRKGKIAENEIEIYEYGYTMILEKMIIFFISIVIAFALNAIWEVIALCVTFIPLRIYSGGYHAKSRYWCMVLSGLMLIIGIIVVRSFQELLCMGNYLVIELICGIILVLCALVEVAHRKISHSEKNYFKKVVIFIAGVEMIIGILLLVYEKNIWASIIIISNVFNICSVGSEILLRYKHQ